MSNKDTDPADLVQPERMLQWFEYEHLPLELQVISMRFAELAEFIVEFVPRNAERTVALRKLLEGKDAALRASIPHM